MSDHKVSPADKRLLSTQSIVFLTLAVFLLLVGACSYLYLTSRKTPVVFSEAPEVTPTQVVVRNSESLPHVVKIALYNGTNSPGLTTRVDNTLKTLSSLLTQVTLKENAARRYADSLVVDISGKNPQAVNQLAAFSHGKVGKLPEGEVMPEGVDILIILGRSYLTSLTPTPTISSSPSP